MPREKRKHKQVKEVSQNYFLRSHARAKENALKKFIQANSNPKLPDPGENDNKIDRKKPIHINPNLKLIDSGENERKIDVLNVAEIPEFAETVEHSLDEEKQCGNSDDSQDDSNSEQLTFLPEDEYNFIVECLSNIDPTAKEFFAALDAAFESKQEDEKNKNLIDMLYCTELYEWSQEELDTLLGDTQEKCVPSQTKLSNFTTDNSSDESRESTRLSIDSLNWTMFNISTKLNGQMDILFQKINLNAQSTSDSVNRNDENNITLDCLIEMADEALSILDSIFDYINEITKLLDGFKPTNDIQSWTMIRCEILGELVQIYYPLELSNKRFIELYTTCENHYQYDGNYCEISNGILKVLKQEVKEDEDDYVKQRIDLFHTKTQVLRTNIHSITNDLIRILYDIDQKIPVNDPRR